MLQNTQIRDLIGTKNKLMSKKTKTDVFTYRKSCFRYCGGFALALGNPSRKGEVESTNAFDESIEELMGHPGGIDCGVEWVS